MVLASEEVLEVVGLLERLLGEQVVVLDNGHLVVLGTHRHPVHLRRVLEVSLRVRARDDGSAQTLP